MPPFIKVAFLMASALNTEKKPNKCPALYTTASSRSTKFWSIPPPRTKKPAVPSPADCTPGSSWMVLRISTSPIKAGSFLTSAIDSSTVPNSVLSTLLLPLSSVTTIRESKVFPIESSMLKVVSCRKSNSNLLS